MGGPQGGSAAPFTRLAAIPPWEGPVVNGGDRLPHDAAEQRPLQSGGRDFAGFWVDGFGWSWSLIGLLGNLDATSRL